MYYVEDDYGTMRSFSRTRFITVEQLRERNLKDLLK